jgi:hypothetical protein
MQEPDYTAREAINSPVLGYEWDMKISRAIMVANPDRNARLDAALSLLSVDARMATVGAVGQWVVWRYQGIVDISDALLRIEAVFAQAVDPRYANVTQPDEPFPTDNQDAYGPLKAARMILAYASEAFAKSRGVASFVISMILLARHVLPDKRPMEKWLQQVLKRAAALYPQSGPPPGRPPPSPRLFALDAVLSDDTLRDGLAEFLASLDPGANRYLRPGDELLQLGFRGTPYAHP